MEENRATLSPPWIEYYSKVEALFKDDPDVKVVFDDGNVKSLNLYVKGQVKAEALSMLMPLKKEFGNITVNIEVFPANNDESKIDLFRNAFSGNPAVSYITTVSTLLGNHDYVVMRNKVVQFPNDNIGDINLQSSTLYEDLMREVFEDTAGLVHFCTDLEGNPGKPMVANK